MKWTSALFSDLRNKIGNQAVASSWKGRRYFRQYVIPANPNTKPQQAHRLTLTNVLKRSQSFFATPANKTLWAAIATPLMISATNAFCKFGLGSYLTAATGVGSKAIKVTGKCTIPLNKAHFYAFATVAETWTDEGAVPTLTFTDLDVEMAAAETEYTIYIGHSDAENDPIDGNAGCTCWNPNEDTGASDVATATSAAV